MGLPSALCHPARAAGLIDYSRVRQQHQAGAAYDAAVSSPQSNGIAEAFVRTLKRDYVRVNPRPDARTVAEQLLGWFARYDDVHPHRALRYRY